MKKPIVKRIKKPWGEFILFTKNIPSTVKILKINPRSSLSLQLHEKRDELWVFLDKGAEVQLGNKKIRPNELGQIFIPRKIKHCISTSQRGVRVLEISLGHFDEKDIVRLKDIYGRDKIIT